MEELDTDEYIRRIKALNAIKDQYEFTTSIQVNSVTRASDLFPRIIMSVNSLKTRLGSVQTCSFGTFSEKKSFPGRRTLLQGANSMTNIYAEAHLRKLNSRYSLTVGKDQRQIFTIVDFSIDCARNENSVRP